LRGDAQKKARVVAGACQLFDEFISGFDLHLKPLPGRILLHAHCHQKAMGLLPATIRLLSRVSSAKIVDLDAGCCGMAGSFGYLREHYNISFAIANRRLLPAIEAMASGDILVAPGFSCRHQIADFSKRKAVHPAVLLRDLLR
jgi:Fe-S oxidoreductase